MFSLASFGTLVFFPFPRFSLLTTASLSRLAILLQKKVCEQSDSSHYYALLQNKFIHNKQQRLCVYIYIHIPTYT